MCTYTFASVRPCIGATVTVAARQQLFPITYTSIYTRGPISAHSRVPPSQSSFDTRFNIKYIRRKLAFRQKARGCSVRIYYARAICTRAQSISDGARVSWRFGRPNATTVVNLGYPIYVFVPISCPENSRARATSAVIVPRIYGSSYTYDDRNTAESLSGGLKRGIKMGNGRGSFYRWITMVTYADRHECFRRGRGEKRRILYIK